MATERFIITGNLAATTFLPWITRHARRLGLSGEPARMQGGQVEILLHGPPDLIDAMELGVSLGPIDVWVETIERQPLNRSEADRV